MGVCGADAGCLLEHGELLHGRNLVDFTGLLGLVHLLPLVRSVIVLELLPRLALRLPPLLFGSLVARMDKRAPRSLLERSRIAPVDPEPKNNECASAYEGTDACANNCAQRYSF